MPLTGQFNSNVAGLERPCPRGMVLICSIAMCISPLESEHFFIVCDELDADFYLSTALMVV